MAHLSLELSRRQPQVFAANLIGALATYSTYGAVAAEQNNIATANVAQRIAIDSNSFHSESYGNGYFKLGTAPLSNTLKEQLIFEEKQFPYAEEVTYRMLHELVHPLLAKGQHSMPVQNLTNIAAHTRRTTDGRQGLSTLGSLPNYTGNKKITEDVTELMSMYAWNPDYARRFTEFLADTSMSRIHHRLGLMTVGQGQNLYAAISRATESIFD